MLFPRIRCFYRQKRFIVFSLIVTFIFLVYQLLSVSQLGKELSKRKPRSRLHTNFRNYEKADGFMQIKYPEDEKNNVDNMWNKQKSVLDKNNIRGVLPENQKYYIPTAKSTFKCIYSGEEIDFSFINDNFCDCSDFTDEPSTSACSYGRFYCSHQPRHNIISIVSYKVNDGICDCCDGSDEWEHVFLPEHTLVPVSKQKGIHQIPCPVLCLS